MKEYLMIGEVLKPQGIKGEVKVKPETDDIGRFLELETLFLDEQGKDGLRVEAARIREGFAYLFLGGVSSVEAAELLRGKKLYVHRSQAAKLPEGRHFIVDLIGLRVRNDAGEFLGTLADVIQSGGADVYAVQGERGFLFPAVRHVIRSIDIEQGEMVLAKERLDEVAVYDED